MKKYYLVTNKDGSHNNCFNTRREAIKYMKQQGRDFRVRIVKRDVLFSYQIA